MQALVKEEYSVFNYIVEEMFYFHQRYKEWPAYVEISESLFGKLIKQTFPFATFAVSHVDINDVPVFPGALLYPSFIDRINDRHYI